MKEEIKPPWAKRYVHATMVKNPSKMEFNDEVSHHECPLCGYIISEKEMASVRYDYGCPRCGNSFQEFRVRMKESNEFKCAICGGTFKKVFTEEEAEKHLEEEFPGVKKEECELVCDDCFKGKVKPMLTPEGRKKMMEWSINMFYSSIRIQKLIEKLTPITIDDLRQHPNEIFTRISGEIDKEIEEIKKKAEEDAKRTH